jgi:hypothetical protein
MKVYNVYKYYYVFGHGGDAEKQHIGTYATKKAMLKDVMEQVEDRAYEVVNFTVDKNTTEEEIKKLTKKVEKFIKDGKKDLDWDFNELYYEDGSLQGTVGIEVVAKDIK